MSAQKKALVLAGGLPQIELIKNLQRRGFYVLLADYYEDPIARRYADEFRRESTLDVEAIREIALSESVCLIITCCTDQALATVSLLSEELGLPCYIGAETGSMVTNKAKMKRLFLQNGIPTADFVSTELNNLSIPFDYPVVVKPTDCNSSKGVVRVDSDKNLEAAIHNARILSRTGGVLVEQFIEGEELSVDCLVRRGRCKVLCVSRNDKLSSESGFVIGRGYCSQDMQALAGGRITEIAQRIADVFGIVDGPMLVQMLRNDKGYFVIEFSSRTGGCTKYRIIELASGIDIIEATVDITLRKDFEPKPSFNKNLIVDEFLYCDYGIFDHLEGFEQCRHEGIIEEYYQLKQSGCELGAVMSSGDRVAAVIFSADSEDEYIDKRKVFYSRASAVDVTGSDILARDLLLL